MRNSDYAYDKIKMMIITAELKPGQAIVETDLMEQLGLGRTPIREALNRLAVDNFIKIIPRHCIMVTELSLMELESIYEMRLTLSKLVADLAAKYRTEEELEELVEVMRELETQKDSRKRVLLDRKFHFITLQMTRNHFLINDMGRYLDLCFRLLFINQNYLSAIDDMTCEAHREIYRCIADKDVDRLRAAERNHILSFRNKFLRF